MSDPRTEEQHARNKLADAEADREARRQALRRMSWKFLVVVVALLAYAGLRGLEGAKSSYDEEHGRPLVIVDDRYADQVKAEKGGAPRDGSEQLRYDAVLLKASDVGKVLGASNPAAQNFDAETMKGVRETVARVGYQSFKGPKELLDRLDEEILDGADDEKKSLTATEAAESRAQANKLPDSSQEKGEVNNALKDRYREAHGMSQQQSPTQSELDKWVADQLSALNKPSATVKEIEQWRKDLVAPNKRLNDAQLLRWQASINQRSINEDLRRESRLQEVKEKIRTIDERAQKQISAVYTVLKPELPRLIKGGVNAPDEGGSALFSFFSPRAVLDEGNGIHVVYQTLRLTFVVVLVFAVLFVVMLLLRPMPFFANGTDALMGQVGGLFGGEGGGGGGATQVAKSIAMTAAALGVGAAVAVAGSTAVGDGKRRGDGGSGGSGDPVEQGRDNRDGQAGARGQRGLAGRRGEEGVVEHVVTLSEPIVYPSPITVNVPPPIVRHDDELLTQLQGQVTELTRTQNDWRNGDSTLERRMGDIAANAVQPLKDNIGGVNVQRLYEDTHDLPRQVAAAQGGVEGLKTLIQTDFAKAISDFQQQLAETNGTVAEMRDNSFERLQNSGGRNLATRAVQVFKGDRHLITDQSVRALRSLMGRPANVCQTTDGTPPDPKKKCCGSTPTDASFCYTTEVEPLLLNRLSALVGNPPMKASELSTALVGGDVPQSKFKKWERVILKYTRMAY
jgi:hypothetical protein